MMRGAMFVLAGFLSAPVVAQMTPAPSPSIPASAVPSPDVVLVPRGTEIVVKTTHEINSYGTESGLKLTFEVVQDAIVDGHVVVRAGDIAEGIIADAQAGENNLLDRKAANLRIQVNTVYSFCGDQLAIDFVRSEYRRRQGLFGSHKDVEVVKGQEYRVPTERPQKVCGMATTQQPLPIPSAALYGDGN